VFVKFVALILVFGATGIGVLSVRQSRLQAVHEMAEARQRVHELMDAQGEFMPAASTPAQVELVQRVIERASEPDPAPPVHHDGVEVHESDGTLVFTLEDGTRVVFVED
jgi:hypothetical protein